MSTNALIGWSGFIGQEILSQIEKNIDIYNSSNIETIRGKSFDTVYFCGLPAEKWRINQQPEKDLENVLSIFSILNTVSVKTFILISTIDVLDCTILQNEDGAIFASHPYGKHRKMMEDWVKDTQQDWHILRLPGLFGKGLKKNVIYDLLFQNQIQNICLSSEFQWYDTSNILQDIQYSIDNKIPILHLFSEPVSVKEIVTQNFPELEQNCIGTNIVKYNLTTKYKGNGYWKTKSEILEEISKYVFFEKRVQKVLPTIAISNLCWNQKQFPDIQKILSRYRIQNLEVALTKYRDWGDLHGGVIKELLEYPYKYVSCQSILFQTPIHIFENPDQFVSHYEYVAYLCNRLSIQKIVFGSPKQRHPGNKDPDMMIPYFQQIGDISKQHNLTFCIEPNSKKYGCTWLTNLQETYEYVQKISHPNIMINFDLGNYTMEQDTTPLENSILESIGHIQISNTFLESFVKFDSTMMDHYIQLLRSFFESKSYNGYISLEMKEEGPQNIIKSIDTFYNMVFSSYLK